MERFNSGEIAKIEDERTAQTIAHLEEANPEMAETLKRIKKKMIERSGQNTGPFSVTPAMKSGAAAHEHRTRKQLGDDY